MNETIESFGRFVSGQLAHHPARARQALRLAYRAYGGKARYFPRRDVLPARQYMLWAANRLMADGLRAGGGPSALVSVFLPCELLHAMDVRVLFPEGQGSYAACAACEHPFVQAAEDRGVPESFCSYHKLLLGMAETGVLPPPTVIVNTTLACDANQLTFRRLAQHYDAPHFTLDVPNHINETSVSYVAEQLRELAIFLERHTGRQLEEARLRKTLERSARTIGHYRTYLDARATRSIPEEMTSELLSLVALHVDLGTSEAEEYTRRLAQETLSLPVGQTGRVRLLWVHTLPNWQQPLKTLLEHNDRCEIVGCDMTFDGLTPPDPAQPYESMARRLLQDHFNGPAARRVESVLHMAQKLQADGVIWFCHWGCKQTLGAAQYAKQTLEQAGFPVLTLDGDGCDTGNVNDGQMVTRLEAFLEQLEAGT